MCNAQTNMIERQIRTGEIHLQTAFDVLDTIKRKDFVPSAYDEYAYAKMEIPLPFGQNMLTPLTEARILQAVAINKTDIILEIGAGSSYMAARLAHNAKQVTTEIEPALKGMAKNPFRLRHKKRSSSM